MAASGQEAGLGVTRGPQASSSLCRPRGREVLRALAAVGGRDLFHGSPESGALGEA